MTPGGRRKTLLALWHAAAALALALLACLAFAEAGFVVASLIGLAEPVGVALGVLLAGAILLALWRPHLHRPVRG